MAKATITGIVNNDGFLIVYFVRSRSIKSFLLRLFKEFDVENGLFKELDDETGEIKELSIGDYADHFVRIQREDMDLELFFGKEKVVAVVRSPNEMKQKLLDHVTEHAQWMKYTGKSKT